MKTFCRIIACLLVAVMALSVIVSCGGGDEAKTSQSAAESKPGESKPNNNSGENKPSAGNTSEATSKPSEAKPSEGTSQNPADNTSAAASSANSGEDDEGKPVINEKFGGREVNFIVNGGEGSTQARSITLGEKDDPTYGVNMATVQRNAQVEKELDVKIVTKTKVGMQEMVKFLSPILISKIYTYDVAALYQYFDLGIALGDTVGSFYNYHNMPEGYTNYINLDAPYWSQSIADTLSMNNVLFEITGDICQTYTGSMFVSFVNATMWNTYADEIKNLKNNPEHLTSVFDIIKKGYWTLDLWMELSQMAYVDNGNQTPDLADQMGLLLYQADINNILTDMFIAGSHINFAQTKADGKPEMVVNSKRNVEFFYKLYQLYCESDAVVVDFLESSSGENGKYLTEYFADGNILMVVNNLDKAEDDLANMTDEFYVLPLPMMDRSQYDPKSPSLGYSTQLGDGVSQYALCKYDGSDENIACVTATMELMGYYSKKWVTPVYYETALKDRYTHDPESREMIDLVKQGIYWDFGFAWSNALGDLTWYFRTDYSTFGSNPAKYLKTKNDNCKNKLRTLDKLLEEAYWVEG